ncbi:response regulator [Verrucomicrobiota bacterium sgz303538]
MNSLVNFLENARILIVDEEPASVRLIEAQLGSMGQSNVRSVTDVREVLPVLREFQPDLVILGLPVEQIDESGVIEQVRSALPADRFLPVVVIGAEVTPEMRKAALTLGAKDVLLKPLSEDECGPCLRNLLEARFFYLGSERQAGRTRELEKALDEFHARQKQERLQSLAKMASGIAHDLNNSFTIMMGFCDLLMDAGGLDDQEDARRSIGTILEATQDAAKMIQQLRNFYRSREPRDVFTAVRVADLVRQVVELAQPKWQDSARGENAIEIAIDVPDTLTVRGNTADLREVLTNLIFNAVDAMPKGGRLSLNARAIGADVMIEVTDTGSGMDEETRQRCFEPFFSTKDERCAGLGLAMVFGIVRRHDGNVEVISEEGRGSTFVVRLPREQAPLPIAQLGSIRKFPQLRILFSDDDAAIRTVVSLCLERAGHTVTVASDGSEALELFEPGKYDVVLTDLAMPIMNGEKLARAIKALAPDQPVVVLTGYADRLLENGQKPAFIDLLLNKPITNEALMMALARVSNVNRPSSQMA